ncbi:MAG TPA: hypothetical protein VIG80_06890 [Bacillaceae bacterium]
MSEKGIKRGQPITFRIPSDAPDHILKHLQKLKETERRNFSSKIAEIVINGLNESNSKQREVITIPLPKSLSKEQRDWLKHEHSEALLGSIVYQLLSDPIRTASIFASLNSSALDIDEALYLQEEKGIGSDRGKASDRGHDPEESSQAEHSLPNPASDDDLDSFDWTQLKSAEQEDESEEEDFSDPLADFLAQMNK